MNHSFENQVTLVTGGASGIGLATARAFAEAGAAVALVDIDENAVGSAAEQLLSAGRKAITARCDVSDEDAVAAVVHQTISTFGQLDIAFNNAAIQAPVAETADARGEDFDRVIAINLRGIWNCMKYELRHMRERGRGVIGLTKSAALEYAARGIRINVVCPGATDTPMVANALANEPETMKAAMREIPLGRLGRSEEIASAVLWLCSPGAGFMVGQVIVPDGGYTTR
jgi:NAD(P)-dependent dehydrogenase (short-subunit alcohol dehydrogenase family)